MQMQCDYYSADVTEFGTVYKGLSTLSVRLQSNMRSPCALQTGRQGTRR